MKLTNWHWRINTTLVVGARLTGGKVGEVNRTLNFRCFPVVRVYGGNHAVLSNRFLPNHILR